MSDVQFSESAYSTLVELGPLATDALLIALGAVCAESSASVSDVRLSHESVVYHGIAMYRVDLCGRYSMLYTVTGVTVTVEHIEPARHE